MADNLSVIIEEWEWRRMWPHAWMLPSSWATGCWSGNRSQRLLREQHTWWIWRGPLLFRKVITTREACPDKECTYHFQITSCLKLQNLVNCYMSSVYISLQPYSVWCPLMLGSSLVMAMGFGSWMQPKRTRTNTNWPGRRKQAATSLSWSSSWRP